MEKPDGSIRMTIDYKRLNCVTKKDAYPLPNIEDLYMKLYPMRWFTKIDCYSGFYQIGLDDASAECTAFACEWGLFEFRCMPMGVVLRQVVLSKLCSVQLLLTKLCKTMIEEKQR